MLTDEGCLFAKVGSIAGNHDLAGAMALPAFTRQTISPAVARAKAAFFENYFSFFSSNSEPSSVMKLLISGYLAYSSSSFGSFFRFLITSTVTGGVRTVAVDVFLISFFDFFGSLCL